MFRQELAERPKTSPPLLRPELHADGRHIDSGVLAESCRAFASTKCNIEKPPPAATQAGQSADTIGIEFRGANRLFVGLLFQQVRPRNRRSADAIELRRSPRPVSPSLIPRQLRRPVAMAQKALSAPASIETLLTELARRWLHSLAAKEKL